MSRAGVGAPVGSGNTQPRVVAVGGGHGLAATLRAVRTFTDDVTAVVSVADDGGSSGRLRELWGIMPPGDLRTCLVALAEPDSALASAFTVRYVEGELAGHALGNLVVAALMEATGGPVAGLDEACRLLGVRGRVLPATTVPVVLRANADGGEVDGQVAVSATGRIRRVSLVPDDPDVPKEVVDALAGADQIVLGPGSLFTSVLAAAAVPGVRDAIASSAAMKVFVCNLEAHEAETRGFDVARHVAALAEHGIGVDVVVADPSGLAVGDPGARVVEAPLVGADGASHDPVRLACVLSDLLR